LVGARIDYHDPKGGRWVFPICILAGYEREPTKKLPSPPHKKKGKQILALTGVAPDRNATYIMRFPKRFVDLMNEASTVDYTRLLPHIIPLADAPKRAVRFFLGHQKFVCHGTQQLAAFLWLEHNKAAKSTRSDRERALKAVAKKLKDVFGIIYDANNDRWEYTQHPNVYISIPSNKPKEKIVKKGFGSNHLLAPVGSDHQSSLEGYWQ